MFAVYDGVGGNNYGEVASDLAAKIINSYLSAYFSSISKTALPEALSPDNIIDILLKSFEIANHAILQQMSEQPSLQGKLHDCPEIVQKRRRGNNMMRDELWDIERMDLSRENKDILHDVFRNMKSNMDRRMEEQIKERVKDALINAKIDIPKEE